QPSRFNNQKRKEVSTGNQTAPRPENVYARTIPPKPRRTKSVQSTAGYTGNCGTERQQMRRPIICYGCGQPGHKRNECPSRGEFAPQNIQRNVPQPETYNAGPIGGQGRGQRPGNVTGRGPGGQQTAVGRGHARVFAIDPQETRDNNAVVTGTLLI